MPELPDVETYKRYFDATSLHQREKDGRCPKCNTSVQQVSISGRTAYFCPKCQPRTE